jgi:polyisoprenoid-binding protein YceI
MKNLKFIALSLLVLASILIASGFTKTTTSCQKMELAPTQEKKQNQTINLFVTHGHCSTPFAGIVDNLKVITTKREDQGNPLENMQISFEVDPNSFNVCRGEELTQRIKTPGLFIGKNDEKVTFRTTDVYTMGLDWYQLNGIVSIKGIENEVKFFATGIRDPKESNPSALVLEGQLNLVDWGIDYDLIVNGKSDSVPTKWMHLNMKIDLSQIIL